MRGDVWFSRVRVHASNVEKTGLRIKYPGHAWEEPRVGKRPPAVPDDALRAMDRHDRGFALTADEFPEAAAIYDERAFRKLPQLFYVGGFIVLRKGIADLLADFDLGPIGLIPFTIFQSDLVTPWPEPFWLLGLGATKQTYLHDQSRHVTKGGPHPVTGAVVYIPLAFAEEGDIAVSCNALLGIDLWIEKDVHWLLFLSNRLAAALASAGVGTEWDLRKCRVVGRGAS